MAKITGWYEMVNGKRVLLRCDWQWCIAPAVTPVKMKGVAAKLCDVHAREARKTGELKLRRH